MGISLATAKRKTNGKPKTAVGTLARGPNVEDVGEGWSAATADIPQLNEAAAGRGISKTVIAEREDCGADVYLWSIRADDGRWMSELGIRVPGELRKHGLASKESNIQPATTSKFATCPEAECEAIERGIDWLQERRIACTGAAKIVIENVLPLLEQSIKEIGSSPARPDHVHSDLTLDCSPGQTLMIALSQLATLSANPIPDPSEVSRIADSLQARGQDEPIIVLASSRCPAEVELPVGKEWLVLAGATRLAAARQIGWTKLQARERQDTMTYEEVLAFAFRNNLDRRTVGTAERAQYAAAIAATVADLKQRETIVAARMRLDRSEVNQLLRFGDLPTKWQQRVTTYERDREDEGGIPWSCAKALLPYIHLAAFRDAVEKRWKVNGEHLRRKDSVRMSVQWLVQECTRPLETKMRHDYGYQNGGAQPRLYEVNDDLLTKLQVEKLPLGKGGKLVEVITNTQLNDQLQAPFLKKIVARQNQRDNGKPDKPVGKKTPLTPAQERAKQAEQNSQLKRRICGEGGLHEQALRLAMAKVLKLGNWITDGLYDDLITTSRDSAGSCNLDAAAWRYEGQLQLRTEKANGESPKPLSGYAKKEAYADYSRGSIDFTNDPADDLLRVRLYTCQAILWPAAGKGVQSHQLGPTDEVPERFPVICPAVLKHWSELLRVTVKDTWLDASTAGPARQWLQRFLQSHNRRQLQAMATSIGAAALIDGAKTGVEEVGKLMLAHRASNRLCLPPVLSVRFKN